MAAGYGYSLDREAVAVLLLCSGREQGPDARKHHVFDLGDFVITCWPDHAVKMVRVLLIERT